MALVFRSGKSLPALLEEGESPKADASADSALISGKPPAEKKQPGQRGHPTPKAPTIPLNQDGRYSAANVMAVLNISHAALYAGMKRDRYPKPDGYDGKRPYWNTRTIREFKEREDREWEQKKAFLARVGLPITRPKKRK